MRCCDIPIVLSDEARKRFEELSTKLVTDPKYNQGFDESDYTWEVVKCTKKKQLTANNKMTDQSC